MGSADRTFSLRLEGDFDWDRGLPLYELSELLRILGQALEAHYLEGVRTGEFEPPSENFPAVWLTCFALLEFDAETSTIVLAPSNSREFRQEAALAMDNLASLLDVVTGRGPLLPAEATALGRTLDTLAVSSYEISLVWRSKSRSVTFDEKSLLWLEPMVRRLDEEAEYVPIPDVLPSLRTRIRALHWASQETEEQLRKELARLGFVIRDLDGSRMTSIMSIYEEGARAGLADHLWGEWNFDPVERTAIIWAHADEVARNEPQAFVEQVVEILRQADESGTQVNLILLGEPEMLFPRVPRHP